jgi:hypothetical protein
MSFWLLCCALFHPIHETVSEVQWNTESLRFEVAIRLHGLDEQWIRRQAESRQSVEVTALAYLRKHFRIDDAATSTKPSTDTYHWIGREEEWPHVWWYFEINPRSSMPPTRVRQTMLFEHDRNYRHRVVDLSSTPNRAGTAKYDASIVRLDAPDARD